MLEKKFWHIPEEIHVYRKEHWTFCLVFEKLTLTGTCWAPEANVTRSITLVFGFFSSVLSSHLFCSVAVPGFCWDSYHFLLLYPGKHTCNPASLEYYGYSNHRVKNLSINGSHCALWRITSSDRFFQWLTRKFLKYKAFLMGYFHWRDSPAGW